MPTLLSHTDIYLGQDNALQELHSRGCSLATKPWVDNHWRLILWKVANLTQLIPEDEREAETRRWGWKHVMEQLLYRYARHLL
jgi:breast cancer 2 susceptibility protein